VSEIMKKINVYVSRIIILQFGFVRNEVLCTKNCRM